MRCITCGDRMRLVERVPDNTMFVSGYEHHTSVCLTCGETERRLVFRRSDEPLPEEPPTPPTNELKEPPSTTAALAVAEPEAGGLTQPRRSLRARLDDLRQRVALSDQKAIAAKRDEEERKRFIDFWDGLVPTKLSAQPM
jgi:hypothetical protein